MDNIECKLKVGDRVQIDWAWGGKVGGKKGKVVGIRRWIGCESGFMVKTDAYSREIDANWLKKLDNNG